MHYWIQRKMEGIQIYVLITVLKNSEPPLHIVKSGHIFTKRKGKMGTRTSMTVYTRHINADVMATYEHQHLGVCVVCCKGTPYSNGSGNTFNISFYYLPVRNVVVIIK